MVKELVVVCEKEMCKVYSIVMRSVEKLGTIGRERHEKCIQ